MAININTATLGGRIGKDIEERYGASGKAMCNFTLATNRSWKNKETNEWEQETTWHRVVCYGYAAEKAIKNGSKGAEVIVIGRINTRKYQDRDGQDKSITEIIADDVQFPSIDKGNEQQHAPSSGRNEYAATRGTGTGRPHTTGTSFDDMSDDIPF